MKMRMPRFAKPLLLAVCVTCWMAASLSAQTQQPQPADLLDEGYKLYDAGKYAEAAHDFEEALKSNPNDDQVIAQLGYAYLNLKEYDKAKAEFAIVAKGTDAKLRAEAIAQLQDMQAPAPVPTQSGLGDEGFHLYDAGKYAEAAKDFESALKASPDNYAVAAQLGYADLNLHKYKEADAAFHIAAQSSDPKLRAQALAELKLLHPPTVYFDVYGDLIYLNRFDDFVGDLQTRLAKSIRSKSPFSVYWGNTFSRDSNSQNGQFPIIFADNVYMSGVGLLFQPDKAHYSIYGEANMAVNLLKYPTNEYNERSDLRVIAGYDNRIAHRMIGPLGALTLFRLKSDRLYTYMDGSAGYYTRYFGDAIAYGQMQEGASLGDVGYLEFLGYARYNLAADSIHEFYNNLGEIGPGFEIRSSKERVNVSLQTEYLHGMYFGTAANGSPNPYGATYNDLRVTLLFGHRF